MFVTDSVEYPKYRKQTVTSAHLTLCVLMIFVYIRQFNTERYTPVQLRLFCYSMGWLSYRLRHRHLH
jgi:hypothetical protein